MGEKPATNQDGRYVPTRSDVAGEVPALRQGEIGTNEADGTVHVMRANGRASTLPTADGFTSIRTLTQDEYDAIDPKDPTTLYIVTANPES
jgi:hypothetical protein